MLRTFLRGRVTGPRPSPPPTMVPMPGAVEFVAYGRDFQLAASVCLTAARLTDLLNGADEFELSDVVVLDVATGTLYESSREIVARSQLLAVKAGEPRGDPRQRLRTRQHAMGVVAGPYLIHGYLHTRAGADPMLDVGRRRPMIPLTTAAIEGPSGSGWRHDEAETLIVNRDLATWFQPLCEDDYVSLCRASASESLARG